MIQGARRVGKSTVAEEFAKNEYRSYIKIDFANISEDMSDVMKSITDLDLFFLRLQAEK
ncbi:MAG: AAA family ATPase [Solobacterium sp.]|nr:AAA family ATPase [Solobacterium sp.]